MLSKKINTVGFFILNLFAVESISFSCMLHVGKPAWSKNDKKTKSASYEPSLRLKGCREHHWERAKCEIVPAYSLFKP